MWPREVADPVPLNRFGFEIDVAFECEQQREFLLIRAVLSVHLSVRLRCAASDAGMPDALAFDMPVELRLELAAIVITNFTNAKRAFFR